MKKIRVKNGLVQQNERKTAQLNSICPVKIRVDQSEQANSTF